MGYCAPFLVVATAHCATAGKSVLQADENFSDVEASSFFMRAVRLDRMVVSGWIWMYVTVTVGVGVDVA